MDLNSLKEKAKDAIDKRGGDKALKEDLEELKDVATGSGGTSAKAREAFEALKEPGTNRPEPDRDRRA